MKPLHIIGNDMSLTDSGLAVIRSDGSIAKTRSIKTGASPNDHRRIDFIVENYFDFVNPFIQEGPCAFVFEDIQFSGRGSAKAGARFELLGAIKWCIRVQGLPIWGITPGAWKSRVLYPNKVPRKSDESKKAVNRACANKYKFFTDNLNISDAVGIGKCGYHFLVENQKMSMRPMGE
jgi:hypothetical protein